MGNLKVNLKMIPHNNIVSGRNLSISPWEPYWHYHLVHLLECIAQNLISKKSRVESDAVDSEMSFGAFELLWIDLKSHHPQKYKVFLFEFFHN